MQKVIYCSFIIFIGPNEVFCMTKRSYSIGTKKTQCVMGKGTSDLHSMMRKPLEILEWNSKITLRRILGK